MKVNGHTARIIPVPRVLESTGMYRKFLVLLLLVSLSACSSSEQSNTLTVFAAASLTESFTELAAAFEAAHPAVEVSLNFAGSNTLRAQIESGARADVYASADTREMNALIQVGLVNAEEESIFLHNQLVLITPESNPASITSLDNLSRLGLKVVLAAEEVPVGRYTRLMLENVGADFATRVLANVVSNETTVKQVVAKIQLGEADAGIVYRSDAVAAPELPVFEIPAAINVLADYPIALLKDAPNPELAKEFVAFVLSQEGQAILQKWGFAPKQ